MSVTRSICGAALAAVLAAAVVAEGPAADDDQLLKSAQIGSDGPALLAYFRQRTVGDVDRKRIEELIRHLGDPAYAVREQASADLITAGLPAIGPLRIAVANPDVEIARRAERCLERIERVPSTALSAAAARAIARRKPPGAVGVLLAYLPLADDEGVADEVREALATVAASGAGGPDPLLAQALGDSLPVKRAAAAEALVRTGNPAAIEMSRKSLTDPNADVRLRTALALVTAAKDKTAVPALIGLLGDLPQGAGWRIEDVLVRLAGEGAPKATLGEDDAARRACRDAWLAWWEKDGPTTDLAKLDAAPAMLGHTLLLLRDRNNTTGKIVELGPDRKVAWKIDGLLMPLDALVVGRDRVLIVEQQNNQVSERDFAGKVIWRKQVQWPTGVQRLANGNTLVVCRNQIVEFDPRQREVFSHQRGQMDIVAAHKLRNGELVFATTTGSVVRLDAKGKEVKAFPIGRMYTSFGGLEVLPNNHVLVTQRDTVNEYDTAGKEVWKASVSRPTSVQRLPNGNTLVASGLSATTSVAELDRSGRAVWEYKSPDGAMVWRAKRKHFFFSTVA